MLYSATDTSANSWILPFASSAGGYFTGYAIANPNEMLTVQTDVTVEFVSRSGAVIDRTTISLSPANRHVAMIAEGRSGYVRITSNFPIQVVGAIGTKDGTTLDQVPGM
jgi:hypothetical protein